MKLVWSALLSAVMAGCAQAATPGASPDGIGAQGEREITGIPQIYQGIEGIQVLCLVQSNGAVAPAGVADRICNAMVKEAAVGADLPVERIEIGDPRVLAADQLTILAHVSVLDGDHIAVSMRPYRPIAAGSDVLFGSMPRVGNLTEDAALASIAAASLDEILPWRQQERGPRRID